MRSVEFVEKAGGYGFIKPVEGYITSYFGERTNPVNGKSELHNGLDIACENGTPAVAVENGVVAAAGDSSTYGKYLKYSVGDGIDVFYAHLSQVLVKEGAPVTKGQIIAKTGNTGLSTGPHLHLTVYKDGVETDPLQFFEYEAE